VKILIFDNFVQLPSARWGGDFLAIKSALSRPHVQIAPRAVQKGGGLHVQRVLGRMYRRCWMACSKGPETHIENHNFCMYKKMIFVRTKIAKMHVQISAKCMYKLGQPPI